MAHSRHSDPHRRFTWGKALAAAVLPFILGLLLALMGPAGQAGGERFVQVVWFLAGLCSWWAFAVFILWWPPSPGARRAGSSRCVEFSTVRRLAYVAVWLPSGALLAGSLHPVVAVAISIAMATVAWVGSAVRIEFDERGVEQVGTGHRHLRLAWSEIQLAQVLPDAVFLWRADRKSIRVNCRQVDGYPELAAAILRYLPPGTRGLEQGRPILEAQAPPVRDDPA